MLSLTGISKSFGTHTLFSGAGLNIGARDRLALLGANGSGKSTLLDIIAGEASPDDGCVTRRRDLTVGYLHQAVTAGSACPLLQEVTSAPGQITGLAHRIQVIQDELSQDQPAQEQGHLLKELGALQHRFEDSGGYDVEHEAKAVLCGLGFTEADFNRPLSALSGGWLMRAELAKILLLNPDLLLLDEPTNHLDLDTQLWFENYLQDYQGAVLLTSHDRAFLNRVVRCVLVIESGRLVNYAGNYDDYIRVSAQEKQILEATARRQTLKIEHTERFIERFRSKNTKASQVQSRIKSLAKIQRLEVPRQSKKIKFHFPEPPHAGREIISLEHLTKAYDGKVVYADINLVLERGDRAVLVGPNGAGKTTLLRILAGRLKFEAGERRLGPGVITAYYAQYQLELLEPQNTVLSELRRVATGQSDLELRRILGGFLFGGDNADKRVAVLSGGEKARLALAKMLTQPANFLLMDEPTNHLDIASREVLTDALEAYQGTLCFITHDRTLIRQIANKIIEIKSGIPAVYPGDYDSFLYHEERRVLAEKAQCEIAAPPAAGVSQRDKRAAAGEVRNEYYRRSTPVKKHLERLETELAQLEGEQKVLETQFASPGEYKDSEKVVARLARYTAVKARIVALTEEWGQLAAEDDRLKADFEAEMGQLDK